MAFAPAPARWPAASKAASKYAASSSSSKSGAFIVSSSRARGCAASTSRPALVRRRTRGSCRRRRASVPVRARCGRQAPPAGPGSGCAPCRHRFVEQDGRRPSRCRATNAGPFAASSRPPIATTANSPRASDASRSMFGASRLQTEHHGAQNHRSVGISGTASWLSANASPPSSRGTSSCGTGGPTCPRLPSRRPAVSTSAAPTATIRIDGPANRFTI